jgi:hypothetical protein
VDLVEEGKAGEFRKELSKLIPEIKEKGEAIETKEILQSDIIVPLRISVLRKQKPCLKIQEF